MSDTTCPKCGARLAGSDLGACPRCLLAAGLDDSGAPRPDPDTPSLEVVAEAFPQLEILELVGRGGMGVVYKARQVGLDRIVALKILPPALADDPAFSDRFSREARTMARLDHPHIVRVHDFGEADGRFCLLMEYVDGLNLRQVIEDGGLAPREALGIVPQICEALQYAHDRGVVHRDIKPENVLLDRDGRVKITDFGLAKLLHGGPAEHTLTNAGQVMGTPQYMAPEQYRTPDDVDHRADIYSLGVVFYEMLTGDVPMGRFARPSQKVEIDVRLDEVVLRTLEREREQRYQQASDVRTEVATIVSGPATRQPAPRPAPRPGTRRAPEPEGPPRLSRLAVWGFLCAVGAILLPFLMMIVVRLAGADGMAFTTSVPLLGVLLMAGFLLSLVAWIQIGSSRGRLKGLGFAVTGTLLAPIVFLVGIASMFVMVREAPRSEFHDGVAGGSFGGRGGPLVEPEIITPEARPTPPLAVPPPAPVRGEAKAIHGLWNSLGKVLAQGQVTPSDLVPFVTETDLQRLSACPEDVKRPLVKLELLGIPMLGWPNGVKPFIDQPITNIELDPGAPLATVTVGQGASSVRFRLIREEDRWRFAVAPVRRGTDPYPDDTREADIWTRVTGGGARETDPVIRRSIATDAEVLLGIMKAYWEPEGVSHVSRVPRSMYTHLIPPSAHGSRRGQTAPVDTTEGKTGRLGLVFLDAATLPHPLSDYEILKIDVETDGKQATVITQAGDDMLAFPIVFENGRWWLDLDLIAVSED